MCSRDAIPFPQLSSFIEANLKTPLVEHDPDLRLWCIGVKDDADDGVNAAAVDRSRLVSYFLTLLRESNPRFERHFVQLVSVLA